jgi:hypothetical protein
MSIRSLSTDARGRPVFGLGRLSFLRGVEGIRKRISDRLRFFKGSWFADLSAGIDGSFLGTKSDVSTVRAILAQEILATQGVSELLDFQISLDPKTRQLSGTYTALSAEGQVEGVL